MLLLTVRETDALNRLSS